MSGEKRFCAKVLLFGEYSVILNSMALSLPYPLFEGRLCFKREGLKSKDGELMSFVQYLRNLERKKKLDFPFDVASFAFDVGQGLVFDSSIPQGYGVGSSGALCAAVYERYGTCLEKNKASIKTLKHYFALMESHFHGSSSGVDPLMSYFNHPILVHPNGEVDMVELPQTRRGLGVLFLVDTGRSRKTEPLVNLFLEKYKNKEFKEFCSSDLLPVTNHCISSFLQGNQTLFEDSFRTLSAYQLKHLRPMIPQLDLEVWQRGLETGEYSFKLCGAGGGGFLLGYTHNFEKAKEELRDYEIRVFFHC